MTATDPRTAILDALAPLAAANSTAEVAELLAGCLAFSWPHLTTYCPVARWLLERLPDGTRIQVGTAAVHVAGQVVPLPQIVAAFAREYDDGKWPQLVDNPRRLWAN